MIANAGVMLLGPIEDAPMQEWEQMIDLNLKGLLYTSHAALPPSFSPPGCGSVHQCPRWTT